VKLRIQFAVFVLGSILLSGLTKDLSAQSLSVLRDSEIETILRAWADPLLESADLDPDAVSIRLVNDTRLNAFVAGGQNIFLNSGLLMATEDPLQVIGVVAHEIGHISGGHLARSEEASRQAQTVALLHTILGIGAAAVGAVTGSSSSGEAAGALLSGGGAVGLRHFLAFSRTQETAADQAALKLLEANRISAKGLLKFLQKFENQDLLSPDRQDPYLRTHPLTLGRISFVRNHIAVSAVSDNQISELFLIQHARIRAKLVGFLRPIEKTLQFYPPEDKSVAARYARAIGYYRDSQIASALHELETLLAEEPENPYFHELRGQILFESGQLRQAWPSYEMANDLLPEDSLLMCALARLEIEIGDQELVRKAIGSLEKVVIYEPTNNVGWWLLSIGYGRVGRMADSSLASAEQAILEGRPEDALLYAARAMRGFDPNSPRWLQSNDVEQLARRHIER
tara:strand:- start:1929 stop:3296 length:1368 start_codon:yes stop_codon:yes gene_type:complete